ncbi:alpha/beta fold hydrolase [Mucilaginibacter pedocola]|uniref:Alpha/beta hydrolase n=1 Tax=Mucilaginibacter pedocola TaxID=1792845 RepID=A0A1S9PL52_9SPHI|nr:alpha/beta hydrolase [Mucilaginibacter pedocola]OOQ61690.1 alpha/beta hydrolase [Mucilaginibacter pedocola]
MYSDAELIGRLAGFTNNYIDVNGIKLHYVRGGKGPALILIPGWPETWWAYHKVLPQLSAKYDVIAVDLRGMGSSDKPADGFDKKNMAKDIFELTQQLGISSVNICGHDIGAHVAFSFAANYPAATNKLIMLDTPHPDQNMYKLPMLPILGLNYTYPWWLAFNQVKQLPEALLAGKMEIVLNWLFDQMLHDKTSLDDFDRAVYAQAYNETESLRASNGWYQAFTQDIQDIATYTKIKVPTMGLASAQSMEMLAGFLKGYAENAETFEIPNSGHFLLSENPEAVSEKMLAFLKDSN